MNRSTIHQIALTSALGIALVSATSASAAAQQQVSRKTRAAMHTKEPMYDGRTLSSWIEDLSGAAPTTRTVAAYAIAQMRQDGLAAVPALIKCLDDDAGVVRYAAAYALGEIGPVATAALPRLEKMRDDQNDDLASIAGKSVRKINGELPTGMPPYAGQQTTPSPSADH